LEPLPTLEWKDGCLVLLDQRRLPETEEYIHCRDIDTLADAIRTLAVRGAPAIGIAAAYGCVIAAMNTAPGPDREELFMEKLSVLEGTRPTAVNLFHCISEQRRVFCSAGAGDDPVQALLSSAHRMRNDDLEASRAMGRFGAGLLCDGARVLTHCNAGGLATAGLGTALAVIYEAWERGRLNRVYADETRPLLQGARLTSWELTRAGIPVEVLPDSAAASLMRTGVVDAVVVGSDRVAANGDAANKIGTYPLALAARRHDVPFYVVAPLSTFDPGTGDGDDIVIEQRGREELAHMGNRMLLPPGAGTWNPAFDVTPASLITALICERGIIDDPGPGSVRSMLAAEADL